MNARSMTVARSVDYDPDVADELDQVISLRLNAEDVALLKSLSARMPMKRLTIARAALRLGLAEIERNPAALFQAGIPTERKSEPSAAAAKPKKR